MKDSLNQAIAAHQSGNLAEAEKLYRDVLAAQHDLSVAESALVAAQTAFEKAKVDIDRATGETLLQTGVSIDDARPADGRNLVQPEPPRAPSTVPDP